MSVNPPSGPAAGLGPATGYGMPVTYGAAGPGVPVAPPPEPASERRSYTIERWVLGIGRVVVGLVFAVLLIQLIVLVLAFFLQLFGANPDAGFAEWVYRSADRIMQPFRGLFTPITTDGDSVVDTSLLFAIVIYAIVALIVYAFVAWLGDRFDELKFRREKRAYDRRQQFLYEQELQVKALQAHAATQAAQAGTPVAQVYVDQAGAVQVPGAPVAPVAPVAPAAPPRQPWSPQ